MSTQTGACPKCGDLNSYTSLACSGCGGRLPWADALDEDRRQRIAAQQAATQAQQQAQVAAHQAQVAAQKAAQQAARQAQLGRGQTRVPGKCPNCGQEQLVQFQHKQADDGSLQAVGCCLGTCLFWPLLLILPFLRRPGAVTFYCRCLNCGHQWRV
jgi:DNA-directed RNA polymerase subunit M/transcription elongation factor TFIIS